MADLISEQMFANMDPTIREMIQNSENNLADAMKNPEYREQTYSVTDQNSVSGRPGGNERDNSNGRYSGNEHDVPYRNGANGGNADHTGNSESEYNHRDNHDFDHYRIDNQPHSYGRSPTPSVMSGSYKSNTNSASNANANVAPTFEDVPLPPVTRQDRTRWVVEINQFAEELCLSEKIPSEMTMMQMNDGDLFDLWQIYDEKYNQNRTQFVMRNIFAIVGIMLGLGIERVVRIFKSETMDMVAWADRWYIEVTTERPGRTPPFDKALLRMLRRLPWVRDIASCEGSILVGYVQFMWKEYKQQKNMKDDMAKREKEMEERIRKSVKDDYVNMMKESQSHLNPKWNMEDASDTQSQHSNQSNKSSREKQNQKANAQDDFNDLPFDTHSVVSDSDSESAKSVKSVKSTKSKSSPMKPHPLSTPKVEELVEKIVEIAEIARVESVLDVNVDSVESQSQSQSQSPKIIEVGNANADDDSSDSKSISTGESETQADVQKRTNEKNGANEVIGTNEKNRVHEIDNTDIMSESTAYTQSTTLDSADGKPKPKKRGRPKKKIEIVSLDD